jgi:hypothetical protein
MMLFKILLIRALLSKIFALQNKQKDFVVNFFYYSSFSKTNGTLDSWQDIMCAKSRIECGFWIEIAYILHSIHHHSWKILSLKFTS